MTSKVSPHDVARDSKLLMAAENTSKEDTDALANPGDADAANPSTAES